MEHGGGPLVWTEADDPVELFMILFGDDIAVGWRSLVARTLVKLLAVASASPQRREAVNCVQVHSTPTELCFGLPGGERCTDAVLGGIFRKARYASRAICPECGRPAQLRPIGEDDPLTLCAKCAAPLMLENAIWELGQSTRLLAALRLPVSAELVPLLLRPSFVQAATASNDEQSHATTTKMPISRFLPWAGRWRELGEFVRLVH